VRKLARCLLPSLFFGLLLVTGAWSHSLAAAAAEDSVAAIAAAPMPTGCDACGSLDGSDATAAACGLTCTAPLGATVQMPLFHPLPAHPAACPTDKLSAVAVQPDPLPPRS